MNALERRNNILEHLLLLLVSAGDIGLGPDPKDMNKDPKKAPTIKPTSIEKQR